MSPADENQEQNHPKLFSIRQYTLSCRQKNLFHCWPFPVKYLLLCLSHGVNNILPPLDLPPYVIQSSEHVRSIDCMQKDNKDNPIVVNDEGPDITEESAGKRSYNSRQLCHSSGIMSRDVSSNMLCPERQALSTPTTLHSCLDVDKWPIRSLDCSRMSRKNDRSRKGKQKKRWMVDILAVAKPCSLEDLYKMNREIENGCNSELAEECSNQKLDINSWF
ncbi:uncharacterized protein LOC111014738 [Momordica charantia]|uniref:Uncharacterized protein LOC111014738 n=1 Tax=Momordica charantia TaxID=3673 RepID=A0A6J1CW12_MOMCH|nr:uncharacterized protein LOC111014738 [Momordica charantia]XP_022145236.1 uncharacterized protein LOC111014738 [Momordica charantia]XP_022145237.1 uncharacterized protein LOC111014738 [Momordica charantia]